MSKTYQEIMDLRNQIMKDALKLNYEQFEYPGIGFDYEGLMMEAGYDLDQVKTIQLKNNVGHTPLIELKRLSAYAKSFAQPGYGARIFLKDEAANLSGSFK